MTGNEGARGERRRPRRSVEAVKEGERRVKKESNVSPYISTNFLLLSPFHPMSARAYMRAYSRPFLRVCVTGGERGKKGPTPPGSKPTPRGTLAILTTVCFPGPVFPRTGRNGARPGRQGVPGANLGRTRATWAKRARPVANPWPPWANNRHSWGDLGVHRRATRKRARMPSASELHPSSPRPAGNLNRRRYGHEDRDAQGR